MTTERDEATGSDRCAIPSCGRPTGGGFFCEQHRPGYRVGDEHPATRVSQTSAQTSRDGDE